MLVRIRPVRNAHHLLAITALALMILAWLQAQNIASRKTSSLLKDGELSFESEIRRVYTPSIQNITGPFVAGSSTYDIPNRESPDWTQSLGEQICIADVDTRPMNGKNQIWADRDSFEWSGTDYNSYGYINHYFYSKIHGYRYQFVHIITDSVRTPAWNRIPAIASLLQTCQFVIYVDSDVIFPHLHLSVEWLLNYWNITEDTTVAMSMEAVDWHRKQWNISQEELEVLYSEPYLSWVSGRDSNGNMNLNAGLMIVQNTSETQSLLQRWGSCPESTRYPGCENLVDDWPAEQGAFNEYIRYDFPTNIVQVPCDEGHGYPGAPIDCDGVLIRHYTLQKDLVKDMVVETMGEGMVNKARESILHEKKALYVELSV